MFKSKSNKVANKASKQEPVFKQSYFNNCHRTYSCIHCRAHLANHDELISKLFQGNHGRAYLFNRVTNIGCKPAVQRELLTGLHAVADIYCDSCETTLGWKYEQAYVPSQKYKEGKYIIELVHMLKENEWDLTSYNTKKLLDEIETKQRADDCTTKFRNPNGFSSSNNNSSTKSITSQKSNGRLDSTKATVDDRGALTVHRNGVDSINGVRQHEQPLARETKEVMRHNSIANNPTSLDPSELGGGEIQAAVSTTATNNPIAIMATERQQDGDAAEQDRNR